ncbi:MAG TPA: UDP-2,3-diacylglucosamine diphosphatase [Candidatus Kapabacteria bacterium]|nr:UDP-2,3-diacylglucosamine diphosphatase [Candidatus Kapabacteria bacterium]
MIYFISDVHLGFYEKELDLPRELIFLRFLDTIKKDAERIFLVGDIFDYWFDYKTVIPKQFFRVLNKLWELRQSGIKIDYIIGNHDFGHLSFFEEELDIPLYKGDISCEIKDKKFYISHGDGKNLKDKGYLLLKKITRNPLILKLYLMLHPNFGIWLASGSSKKSRSYTDNREHLEDEPMKEFAYRMIDDGYDFVIMGHRHKSEFTKYKDSYYINLGEWFKEPMFAQFDGINMSLRKVSELV